VGIRLFLSENGLPRQFANWLAMTRFLLNDIVKLEGLFLLRQPIKQAKTNRPETFCCLHIAGSGF